MEELIFQTTDVLVGCSLIIIIVSIILIIAVISVLTTINLTTFINIQVAPQITEL